MNERREEIDEWTDIEWMGGTMFSGWMNYVFWMNEIIKWI